MGQQLPLPAAWAHGFGLVSRRDPTDELRRVDRHVLEARAAIGEILERLTGQLGVAPREVDYTLERWIDDALADLAYEARSRLERDAEEQDPV